MITNKTPITGGLYAKNGQLYAVINLYVDGTRSPKWVPTGIKAPADGKIPRKASAFLAQELGRWNAELDRQRTAKDLVNTPGYVIQDPAFVDMRFVDYLHWWLKSKMTGRRKTTPECAKKYGSYIDGRIAEFFVDRRLADLAPDDFDEFYDHLAAIGRKGSTMVAYHNLFKQALKYGVERRKLRYSVVDGVERPDVEKYLGDYYTVEEALAALKAFKGHPLYIPVLLAVYYGLRRSEVLGLRWSSIDFAAGTISIEHKVIDGYDEEGNKCLKTSDAMKTENSRRTLPLVDFVAQELRAEKIKQENNYCLFGNSNRYNRSYMDYICVDELGTLIRPAYISDTFKTQLAKHGLRVIRYHDLRHTCASLLAKAKVPLYDIAHWLGHSSTTTTEMYYAYFSPEEHLRTATVMEKLLDADGVTKEKTLAQALNGLNQSAIIDAFASLDPFTQRAILNSLLEAA